MSAPLTPAGRPCGDIGVVRRRLVAYGTRSAQLVRRSERCGLRLLPGTAPTGDSPGWREHPLRHRRPCDFRGATAQGGRGSLEFSSQFGSFTVDTLPVVHGGAVSVETRQVETPSVAPRRWKPRRPIRLPHQPHSRIRHPRCPRRRRSVPRSRLWPGCGTRVFSLTTSSPPRRPNYSPGYRH